MGEEPKRLGDRFRDQLISEEYPDEASIPQSLKALIVEANETDASWSGYLEIVDEVKKKGLEMGLHLDETPLRFPLAYLETARDYINEAARHIQTRNILRAVQKLPAKWRKGPNKNEEACADELEALVKPKDRRRRENRGS